MRRTSRSRNLCPLCSLCYVDASMKQSPCCRHQIFRGVSLAFKRRGSGRLRWFLVRNEENERRTAREVQYHLGSQWHHYGSSPSAYMLYSNGVAALVAEPA